jgi:hypothetical protein
MLGIRAGSEANFVVGATDGDRAINPQKQKSAPFHRASSAARN